MNIRRVLMGTGALLLFMAGFRANAEGKDASEAEKAAHAWLGAIDGGQYQKSWEDAADYFKKAVPQKQWTKQVEAVRQPLGKLKSRTLASAMPARELPGAPDGEYVVMIFKASYENKANATETVTAMKGTDGAWRIAGYFIR